MLPGETTVVCESNEPRSPDSIAKGIAKTNEKKEPPVRRSISNLPVESTIFGDGDRGVTAANP